VLTLALAVARPGDPLLNLDQSVRDWALTHRWEPLWHLARTLNHLGSANLLAAICLVLAVVVGVRGRTWRPFPLVLGTYALSYLVVGPVKVAFDRKAPLSRAPDAVLLFGEPGDLSYPSGHVVNTFIWYQVLVILLGAGLPPLIRRVLRVAPPVIVSATVLYLAFHWLTDVLAALALGLLLDRLLARAAARAAAPAKDRHAQNG